MKTPVRLVVAGLIAGMASAFAPSILADEAAPAIDVSRLVKFEDRDYLVDYEDWVSTDPISTSRIKKVEAGRVSYVTVTQTSTGTYSTDGMVSPHVQYPGITVKPATSDAHRVAAFVYQGNSFVYLRRGDLAILSSASGTCVTAASFVYC